MLFRYARLLRHAAMKHMLFMLSRFDVLRDVYDCRLIFYAISRVTRCRLRR